MIRKMVFMIISLFQIVIDVNLAKIIPYGFADAVQTFARLISFNWIYDGEIGAGSSLGIARPFGSICSFRLVAAE
jgi:hypothetical protein